MNNSYKIFIIKKNDIIVSAMYVYIVPKIPKPNGNSKAIAYLTNVYTRKQYRNKGIGTKLLNYIKEYMIEEKCELIFAWTSTNSIDWYLRNAFYNDNELLQCQLIDD